MKPKNDTPPKRIWATEDAENFGEDSFYSTSPFNGGHEYILTSEVEAMVAAALREAAEGLLDWYTNVEDDRGPHMVVRALTPKPASAALDKLIAEAVAAERNRVTRIAASLFPGGYDNNRIKIEDRLSEIAAKGAQT